MSIVKHRRIHKTKIKKRKRVKPVVYDTWFKKYYYELDRLFSISVAQEINSKATNVLSSYNIKYLSKQESFVLKHCVRLAEHYTNIETLSDLLNAVYAATQIKKFKLRKYYRSYLTKHKFHELKLNFICFVMYVYYKDPKEKAFKVI